MRWRDFLVLAVAAVGSFVDAVPTSRYVVHERRGNNGIDGSQWVKRGLEDKDTVVPVRIGLVQRNLDKGLEHVLSVSDPSSASYGQHWSREEVHREFAPDKSGVKKVLSWLGHSGIKDARQSDNRGWISFNAPLSKVETLLDANYHEYHREDDGTKRLGCDEYSLPQDLVRHIDYITPGVSPMLFPLHTDVLVADMDIISPIQEIDNETEHQNLRRSDEVTDPNSLKHCDKRITPACYRALYNLPPPEHTLTKNGLGIYSPGWSAYSQKNLNEFFTTYTTITNGTSPELVSINGATAPVSTGKSSGEADLDFEVAYGILGEVEMKAFQASTGSGYKGNFYNNDALIIPLLDAVDGSFCTDIEKSQGFQCGGTELTEVISMSYGLPELFTLSAKKQKRVCNELMKLALQGHTVVVSSGDFGVSTTSNYNDVDPVNSNGCVPQNLDNTGKNKFNGTIFVPDFPANCPYVLAVGATEILPGKTINDPESVMVLPEKETNTWSNFTTFSSGGGFSNYFPRPSYQDTLVTAWQKAHDPGYKTYASNGIDVADPATNIGKNGGVYNRAGRGFPDVSANGRNFEEFWWKYHIKDDGTSVAAPAWAAVVAMLNEERKAVGKGPVGFVNPALYKHPEVFNDITLGLSPGCGTDGFAAVEGWDPSTGLGTPDWVKMKEVFLKLP